MGLIPAKDRTTLFYRKVQLKSDFGWIKQYYFLPQINTDEILIIISSLVFQYIRSTSAVNRFESRNPSDEGVEE